MKSNVLWKISLAIMAGILCGYLIAMKSGLVIGVLVGSLLAFIIADVKAIIISGPVIWRDLVHGFNTEGKITNTQGFVRRGAQARTFLKNLVVIVGIIEGGFLMFFLPALYMPFIPTVEAWPHVAGQAIVLMGFYIITTMIAGLIIGLSYGASTITDPLQWVLSHSIAIKLFGRPSPKMSGESQKQQTVQADKTKWFMPLHDEFGRILNWKRLAVAFIIPGVLIVLPFFMALWPLIAVLGFVMVLADIVLMAFFAVANSKNTAAGIMTAVGIVAEYSCYPTMTANVTEWFRVFGFSIAGSAIGVLLYHWRTRLLLRRTSKELAMAS